MNKHKWYCFYRLQWNHLEFIYDTKKEADAWEEFWGYDPHNFVIEVLE